MLATRASVSQRLTRGSAAVKTRPVLTPARLPRRAPAPPCASSSGGGGNFDDVLAKYADRWEKAENKGAIVGGFAAAATALVIGEWVIHLPLLNVILGFPVQLLGLFVMPPLAVRYLVEGKSVEKDVEEQVGKIVGAVFKK